MSEQADGGRSELWRSLQTLSRDEGVWRPNLSDLLKGELSVLQRIWRIDLQRGNEHVRKVVSASLHALIVQLVPRDARQPLRPEQREKQYQHGVLVCFNIIDYPESGSTKLQERRLWLADKERGLLRISVTTSQRDLNHAIDQIEKLLTGPDYSPADDQSGDTVEPPRAITSELGVSSDVEPKKVPRRVGRRTAIVAIGIIGVVAAALTVAVLRPWEGSGDASSQTTVNPSPIPAPASSPPVLVENVTALQSVHGDLRFVLPEALDMTSKEFAKFNSDVTLKSRDFSPWYADHGAVPVDQGLATVTLRGNEDEPVRITDINAIKECGKPFDGTFFVGYTQGSPEDNVKLGMDLDVPDPVLQEMANTSAQGLHPAGPDYFTIKTIELAPGEVETLTIGAFTKRYGCAFRLQLVVATSRGSFTQDIDYDGKPFKVTAMAAPTKNNFPYSGFKMVYAQNPNLDWERVDPLTYEGY